MAQKIWYVDALIFASRIHTFLGDIASFEVLDQRFVLLGSLKRTRSFWETFIYVFEQANVIFYARRVGMFTISAFLDSL